MAKKKRGSAAALAGLMFGLAAGLAAGTYVLAPNLAGGVNQQNTNAVKELDSTKQTAEINGAQAEIADKYIASTADSTVKDVLKDRPVMVMTTSDADKSDVESLEGLLRKAGAIDAGKINLEDKFFDKSGADSLKSLVAHTLPAGAKLSTDKLDSGTHAGEAMGAALMLNPETAQPLASTEDRALLLNALREGGYITYQDGTILPAQVVIVVTGDSDGSGDKQFAATNLARFAEALDGKGNGTVLAGRVRAASDTGAIGQIRGNVSSKSKVSTVDSIDRTFGQIAAVLTTAEQLKGEAGAYGAASSADAAAPARPDMSGAVKAAETQAAETETVKPEEAKPEQQPAQEQPAQEQPAEEQAVERDTDGQPAQQ